MHRPLESVFILNTFLHSCTTASDCGDSSRKRSKSITGSVGIAIFRVLLREVVYGVTVGGEAGFEAVYHWQEGFLCSMRDCIQCIKRSR